MLDFAKTPMGNRFFNSQLPNLIKGINKIGCELEKANNKPIGLNMNNVLEDDKRKKELIDAMIEHMCVAEKSSNVIHELLSVGFTTDELINDYSFCESDVEYVVQEMNMEEN